MQAKLVSFLSGTGALGSTIVVTGVGFKPQVIIFFTSGDTGNVTTVARGAQLDAIGVAADGGGAQSIAAGCNDGVDPTLAGSFITNRHNVVAWDAFQIDSGRSQFDMQSYDGDGFTVVIQDAFDTSKRIFALCIAGITQAKTGRFQVAGATGNQSISVGFKPDIVFYITSNPTAGPPNTAGSARIGVGFARDSTHQGFAVAMGARAAGTNARRRYAISTECVGTLDDVTNNMTDRATFVSMDADGFTHNWLERATTKHIHYLAIQGGSWIVGNFLTRTDLTPFQVSTPFKPRGLFFVSHGAAEDAADTTRTHSKLTMGACTFNPLARGATAHFDLDGVNPTQCTKGMRVNDAVYERISDAGATDDGTMDILSADDTPGFTAVMTKADPDQALILFVAMGLGSTPGKTPAPMSTPVAQNNPTPALLAAGPLFADP